MKNVIRLIALALLCCLLCACDPNSALPSKEDRLSNVVLVELIEYKNPDQKHFAGSSSDRFDELVPFDPAKVTVLETLATEKNTEFVEAFLQANILDGHYAYNSPNDMCLRLTYENGDFLIIWADYALGRYAGYIGEYAADGTVQDFWGSFSALHYYEDLVGQFFTSELE